MAAELGGPEGRVLLSADAFTNVAPSSTIAQVEIFGPVLVTMSFRTPDEAVALANNTPFGLAASIWSENINLALDVAPKVERPASCGSIAPTCSTQRRDSADIARSGYGREGGREGMWEYLKAMEDEKVEDEVARPC